MVLGGLGSSVVAFPLESTATFINLRCEMLTVGFAPSSFRFPLSFASSTTSCRPQPVLLRVVVDRIPRQAPDGQRTPRFTHSTTFHSPQPRAVGLRPSIVAQSIWITKICRCIPTFARKPAARAVEQQRRHALIQHCHGPHNVCDTKSMTSSPARASVTPSASTSARSFLSRLKSPLSSKSRNYTEFYIQSDDPHRQYAPGDIISGTVIIKIVKPLRITHLVVSLHGYAQVFKNPNAPGDAYKAYSTTVGSGKGKKAGSYFGNGFVSLFEDEVVLCGEGRLSEGVYHFNFELEFPSKGLPSSIDFERGTVAYMLTATLTRPTTMSPTTSCDAKVSLTDTIDIAPVQIPKPRVISLEPISRRTRAKPSRKRPGGASSAATTLDGGKPRTPTGPDIPQIRPISGSNSTVDKIDKNEGPRSPSPSDVSYESQMSSGGASGTEYGIRSVHTTTDGGTQQAGSRAAIQGKTITATIDVLKGGFLRGDQIPIRVTVKHTKHVRSLKGIIITLYRQARVDMHPALPVAPNSKGDKTKSEEYYPKSRTGLGGLSLSSAGSSHVFRKDLCQSFAPLFVDPRTLTAEVKCSVRVPDEAFPTISNVPGAMISFKYYVEVVVDIQGKLTGLDRMVANAGLVNVPSTSGGNSGSRDDNASNMFSTWGGNFVDTDQIRREKGVVSALFEVIIGTKDSERSGKRKQTDQSGGEAQNGIHEFQLNNGHDVNAAHDYEDEYYGYDENGHYHENGQYYDYNYDPADYEVPGYDQHGGVSNGAFHVPPGLTAEETGLSEKEQLRRAEARLLPSQPPGAGPSAAASQFVPQGIPASAPIIPEDEDANPPYSAAASSASTSIHLLPPFRTTSSPSIPSYTPLPPQPSRSGVTNVATSSSQHSLQTPSSSQTPTPRQPALFAPPLTHTNTPSPQSARSSHDPSPDYYSSNASPHVHPTDDKFELQRRRLELERSAPPTEHDEDVDGHGGLQASGLGPPPPLVNGVQGLHLPPSAPVLEDGEGEEDVGEASGGGGATDATQAQRSNRVSEVLPVYRR
ncbi:hypothetical protein IAQ61_001934 [Plenodomus lingam]|uniref:uncharacterized protein n=1 Tax=Leptosphaeria maculans TaxID=5022 RepID=UPI0033182A53|nr:hypothetical protein IAQ61_001934 [Plenodomus lingam]